MGTSTSTGTLAAGESRTFNLAPASAVTLTLLPNVRVTITESPAAVTATGLGGNATRVHEPRLPGTFTYGPYPMGGEVVVDVGSTSGSSVAWVETSSIYSKDSSGAVTGLVGPDGGNPGIDFMASRKSGALVVDWNTNGALSLVSSNGGGEAVALDSSVTCDGLPMVKCTMGSTGTYIADFLFTSAITLAQMQSLQIPVRWSSNNTAFTGSSNSVQVWLYDDTGGTRQWRTGASLRGADATEMRPGVTHTLSFAPGANTAGWSFGGTSAPTNTSDMDAYTIARVRIVIGVPASVAGETVHFGPIRANGRAKPVVSIVMDGQYSSQHSYILPMLDAQGLRCSLAIQGSQVGQSGRMTTAQLSAAYDNGHEMIVHSYDSTKTTGYQNATDFPTQADVAADIDACQSLLVANGWTRGVDFAVHQSTNPYATSVSAARQSLVTAAYQAQGVKAIRRGSNAADANWFLRSQSMARVSNVDPYSVQGSLQITSSHNAASVTGVFTNVKNRGEWGIITVHRSVISTPGSLEMLNSDFLTWIQSLADDARAGKILVLPFGEACRYYGLTA